MALTTGSHLARSQFYGSFGGHCDTGGSPLTPWSLVLVVLDPCWRTAPSSQHKWVIERQQFTARRSFKCVCVWHRPPAIKVLLRDQYLGIEGGAGGRSDCNYICCGWQVAETCSLPLANMLHHCELWHTQMAMEAQPTHTQPCRDTQTLGVSLTTLDIFYESIWLNLVIFLLALSKPWRFIDFRSKSDFSVKRIFKKRKINWLLEF